MSLISKSGRINIAFWNTGLTPPKSGKQGHTCKSKFSSALNVIDELIQENGIVGLCEVFTDNVQDIKQHLDQHHPDYDILDFVYSTDKEDVKAIGRSWFDFALIYRKDQYEFTYRKRVTARYLGGDKLRAGLALDFSHVETSSDFRLYLVHWQSKLNGGEKEREAKATQLGMSVADDLDEDRQVIIMGDFNDSPFDYSVSHYLRASRCYTAVRKKPESFLYNPFGRVVFQGEPYCYFTNEQPKIKGSYYFSSLSKDSNCMLMLDQILFSSSFVSNSGPWFLDEKKTKVFEVNQIKSNFEKSTKQFDHYPVMASISKPMLRKLEATKC